MNSYYEKWKVREKIYNNKKVGSVKDLRSKQEYWHTLQLVLYVVVVLVEANVQKERVH